MLKFVVCCDILKATVHLFIQRQPDHVAQSELAIYLAWFVFLCVCLYIIVKQISFISLPRAIIFIKS
jgi:hypothetical protein